MRQEYANISLKLEIRACSSLILETVKKSKTVLNLSLFNWVLEDISKGTTTFVQRQYNLDS